MYVWRQKWLSHDIQNLPKLIMVELAWFSEAFRLCNTRRLIIELVEFRMYSGGAIRDIDKRRKPPKMSHVANQKKKPKNHVTSYLGKTFIFF